MDNRIKFELWHGQKYGYAHPESFSDAIVEGRWAAWQAALSTPPAQSSGQSLEADLAMLVVRLARQLEKDSPGTDIAPQALDFLKRKGLQGSPLRATHRAPQAIARPAATDATCALRGGKCSCPTACKLNMPSMGIIADQPAATNLSGAIMALRPKTIAVGDKKATYWYELGCNHTSHAAAALASQPPAPQANSYSNNSSNCAAPQASQDAAVTDLSASAERGVEYILGAVQSYAQSWCEGRNRFGANVEAVNTLARIKRMLEDDASKLASALAATMPSAAPSVTKQMVTAALHAADHADCAISADDVRVILDAGLKAMPSHPTVQEGGST